MVQQKIVPDEVHRGVAWLFTIFGLLLLSNVFLFWWFTGRSDAPTRSNVFEAAVALSVVQVVDAFLVILAWYFARQEIYPPKGMGSRRRIGWVLGLPVLAGLLVVNVGYHWLLQTMAEIEPETDQLITSGHYQWWLLVLMCVQPAIIEELFFRRLTFDFFCNTTSVGTAAVVSSIMFAAAHLGGFLSLPYLAFFGFCMAWLRWFTGSLVLPIVLHFLHNLAISLHELATA